jgi:hypothetical protein
MALSIFTDIVKSPAEGDLPEALGVNYILWKELKAFVCKEYPPAEEEWKFGGKNYGWGFRIKDKKRVIVYMAPRDKYFLVSFVFGEKAAKEAMESGISEDVKKNNQGCKSICRGQGIQNRSKK